MVRGGVQCYHFVSVDQVTERAAGQIRLRVGRTESVPSLLTSGQIGYSVNEPFRGRHFAERDCRLLAPLARAHRILPETITRDPKNIPSRRTCERLGAKLVGIFDVPPDHAMYRDGRRRCYRFAWSPE